MASATQFFQFWALAFVTLSVALMVLSAFCRFVDPDLELLGPTREGIVALVASAAQGGGYWFSASLFPGHPFHRMVIPGMIVAIIYWLTHLEEWSGYEIGGIAYFQGAILSVGLLLVHGEYQLAILISAAFMVGLAIIAGIAKSL